MSSLRAPLVVGSGGLYDRGTFFVADPPDRKERRRSRGGLEGGLLSAPPPLLLSLARRENDERPLLVPLSHPAFFSRYSA